LFPAAEAEGVEEAAAAAVVLAEVVLEAAAALLRLWRTRGGDDMQRLRVDTFGIERASSTTPPPWFGVPSRA
jgi:hypothetical protein